METIFIREVNDFKSITNIKYELNQKILTHEELLIRLSCFCLTATVPNTKALPSTFASWIRQSTTTTVMECTPVFVSVQTTSTTATRIVTTTTTTTRTIKMSFISINNKDVALSVNPVAVSF